MANSTFTVSDTGAITAPSQAGVRVRNSANQTLAANVERPLYWDTTLFERQNIHDHVGSSDTITVPVGGAGLWYVECKCHMNSGGTDGDRFIATVKVGGTAVIDDEQVVSGSSGFPMAVAQGIISVSDSDAITCHTFNTSGSVCRSAAAESSFTAVKIW